MNIHGRLPGAVVTRPGARHRLVLPLQESDINNKWIIFDGLVYCVGNTKSPDFMESRDYEKFVRSHAITDYQKYILLGNIDYWDSWARWHTCLLLLQLGKIVLYDPRQEAERAMRRAG